MSLQFKLVLPILLLIMLLVAGTGVMSYWETSENLEDSLISNMSGEAQSASRALTALTESAFQLMQSKATEFAVVRFLQEDPHNRENALDVSEDLAAFIANTSLYDRISIVDAKGRVVASSFKESVRKTFPKDEDYFRRAITGEKVLVEPFINPETGTVYTIVAMPIISGARHLGVIFGSFPLDAVYDEIFAPIKIGKEGYAFGVAAPGVLVLHSDKTMLLKEGLPTSADYRTMVEKGDGQLESVGSDGSHRIILYRRDPATKIVVGVQAASEDVFSGLVDLRNNTIMLVIISVILGSVVLLLLIRPVIRALQRGLVYAEEIAAGKLDGVLQVHSTDETGKLADALRAIPQVLQRVVDEYHRLEADIENGNLNGRGDASAFSGDFAALVGGTNAIMNRYTMVLDNIPSPVIILDKSANAAYLNKSAQEFAGQEYRGKTYGDLFVPEDFNTDNCALRRSLKIKSPTTAETRAHPKGKDMYISYTNIPMVDGAGNIASVLQLITDLTAIKKTHNTILEVAKHALDISNRIATASEQLSSQVQQVSRGADIQHDRVAGTATAMDEMNSTVMEVARNAGAASEQAEATRLKAQSGSSLVDSVIASIKEVNTVAFDLQVNMQDLGTQAEAIGGVLGVISNIADQTNLLALNAAIEAARAGDAGRGFAVVADEVRKLAESTMQATTEVDRSIKGIQTAAAVNIERVKGATESVSVATELAGTSGEALHEILVLAATNSSLITSIATAAEEQSATSEEISRALEEINRIAKETADGMTESSSAVQEMASMSQELRLLLDKLHA